MKNYRWYTAALIGAAACGNGPQNAEHENLSNQEQSHTVGSKIYCDDSGAGRCNYRNPRFNQSGTVWMNNGDLQLLSQSTNFGTAGIGNQHFTFKEQITGTAQYQIHVATDLTHYTNNCIAPSGGVFPSVTGELRAQSCPGWSDTRFLWTFTNEPNSSFRLKNVASGQCIHSDDINFEPYSPIRTAPCEAQGSTWMSHQLMFLDDFSLPH